MAALVDAEPTPVDEAAPEESADAAPAAPAAAPSATDREAERAARLRFFEPRGAAAPTPAPPAPAPAPPMAPAAPAPPPSIKEMKETIRKAGLATADLLERPHVEERYKKALARLAKVVDLTSDE